MIHLEFSLCSGLCATTISLDSSTKNDDTIKGFEKTHFINPRSENKSDTTDFPDHYQANTTRALNLMAQQIVLWWLAYKSHSILEE